ncbi:MAG: pyridoxamine 5'-phosphate oxidase family protein [Dehalococcoidia bacterium]
MPTLPEEAVQLFNDPSASKAIATVDAAGELNLGPKSSLAAVDPQTPAFADIFGSQTRENLEATGKAAVIAFKNAPPFPGWRVRGTFQGFQTSGPAFDGFARQMKKALNLDIRAVGIIRVDEVYNLTPRQAGKKAA